ncbi:OprO/OprP family phosphate-selective porin [bacterium]|nr:OprO/OprP family phosphate-selective porin [bacterium]
MRKIIFILAMFLSLHAQNEYELGKGVQVASLPLFIGGYFSINYKNTDNEKKYKIDDLAILGYGSYEKFSYMAELEFKELYVENSDDDTTEISRDYRLYIERVYLDYHHDENYMLRIGKYNSPIGFWNLLPINVLRETTSSPLSLSILFPKFTTGVGATYTSYIENEFRIDVMLQNNEDIDDEYNNYKVDKHYGFGISYEKDAFSIKANAGYFHKIHDDSYADKLSYALLSAKYDSQKYQLLAELGSQKADNDFTTTYAGYLQGLYRFTEQHLGVMRVESYEDNAHAVDDNIAIIGYTYRPLYPIAIKTEYQFHSLREQNQFLFSFSVLF